MDLQSKLLDPRETVLLYGTTPPRTGTPEDGVRLAAEKLAARLATLPVDGVVVYDIQDETGRTDSPRPFSFTGTVDPRSYARESGSACFTPEVGRPTTETSECRGAVSSSHARHAGSSMVPSAL